MPIVPKRAVRETTAYEAQPEGRAYFTRLDLNENTIDFSKLFNEVDQRFSFSIYPEYQEATELFANVFGVSDQQLLLTNGSDEAISIIANTFIEPGIDCAVVSKPTFFTISHSLRLAGAILKEISMKVDMGFDHDAIESMLNTSVKLAMFASPDNPTGALLNKLRVLDWCQKFPNTLFVIDEAYAEYSGFSLVDCILDYKNLLVVRTLSKAWGLAGLRLGVILGQEDLIKHLKVVRLPYSVNSVAISAAKKMLSKKSEVFDIAKETMERKCSLLDALKTRGYKIIEGAGNFFLLGVGFNAKEFTGFLKQHRVLVRNRSQGTAPGDDLLWGFVRISVGTTQENELLLRTIDAFNTQYAVAFDLDGTLVDTSQSFDKAVDLLLAKYSGSGLNNGELLSLRLEGGFNNNWDAAEELLRRRGIYVPRQRLEEDALNIYFQLARDHERLMVEPTLLRTLKKRHPVFIVTGRSRMEYGSVWAQTFDRVCSHVYCVDDIEGAKPKPAPDHLNAVLANNNLTFGVYVGNSVDDMQAALSAGMQRIGIASMLSAQQLHVAGAQLVLDTPEGLDKVFLL